MGKVVYEVDFDRTSECLWYFRKEWYKRWNGFQTVLIKVPKKVKSFKQLKEWLSQEFPEKELIELAKGLQQAWNKINNEFFGVTEQIMGKNWKYDNYFCYVQNAIVGHYHPLEENVIFVSSKRNSPSFIKNKLQETAEELVHQQYWYIWRETFRNIKFPWRNFRRWILSETITNIILSDKRLRKYFGNMKEGYKFIPKIKQQLMPLWIRRKSFRDFLLKAHKIRFKMQMK